MKYSKVDGVIAWGGGTTPLRTGASFDDDHPLVIERPELFDETDPGAAHKTGPVVGEVERATSAPGEVRVTPGTGPRGGVRKAPGQ